MSANRSSITSLTAENPAIITRSFCAPSSVLVRACFRLTKATRIAPIPVAINATRSAFRVKFKPFIAVLATVVAVACAVVAVALAVINGMLPIITLPSVLCVSLDVDVILFNLSMVVARAFNRPAIGPSGPCITANVLAKLLSPPV